MVVRFLSSIVALCAGVAAVAIAALLLHDTPGPASTSALSAPAPTRASAGTTVPPVPHPGFPAPPKGAVVFAREDGSSTYAVALGVVPHGARMVAQVSLVTGQGKGASGARVSVAGRDAAPCGRGCYRAAVPTAKTVQVTIAGGAPRLRWRVALPSPWPPPSADALLAAATRVWNALRSIAYTDRLSSGTGYTVVSHWQIVAPDRIAYQIPGGSSSVIIGAKRWDRSSPGAKWVASPAVPVSQPKPFWQSYADAHVVGSGTVAGRPVWLVSFYDPGTPGWFRVALDKATSHTLDLRMIATAHFMHDDYGSFDNGPAIVPPTSP